jgi:probable HAF family extracellular repeat protein
MLDLGTLGGENSDAWDISNSGRIIGWSDLSWGEYRGFMWESGVMIDLGRFEGENSEARGLNNNGLVIGHCFTLENDPHAFLWNGDELLNLNDLCPSSFDRVLAFANDVNDAGTVVGSAFDGENLQAFMMRQRPDPTLSRGGVSPRLGFHGTPYTYRVDYFDKNWHEPTLLIVNIDGKDHDMILEQGELSNGTYAYTTQELPDGFFHEFYFYVEKDSGETCRLPAEGAFSGPVNRPPKVLLSGEPGPGARMTLTVHGAPGAFWMAAWSSQPGPYESAETGLTFDIGPGDMHWIKRIFEPPIKLDEKGIGTIDFYLPSGMALPGEKYLQGATRSSGLWCKTDRGRFIMP